MYCINHNNYIEVKYNKGWLINRFMDGEVCNDNLKKCFTVRGSVNNNNYCAIYILK